MKAVTCAIAALSGVIALSATTDPASAQLIAAKTSSIAMGHHHLLVPDVEESARFWLSLGGERTSLGSNTVIKFPNVLVFLREQEPSEGTAGSIVDHVGLQFRELRPLVKRLRSEGIPVITEGVVGGTFEVDDDGLAFNGPANTYLAFVTAPNGAKVELYENTKLDGAVANHHIHFYTNEVDAMKAWYVEKLGATPGQRTGMEAADVGGVNLTFSPSETRRANTKGRSLDHIGFEVDGLEALCKKLKAQGVAFDRPYEKIESIGVAVAFFTDPWGTYVELTEGLDEL